jgi:hypothetical protein
MIAGGSYLHLPLLLENHTGAAVVVELTCEHPEGWTVYTGEARYRLAPGEIVPAQTMIHSVAEETKGAIQLAWVLKQNAKEIGRFVIFVYLREWTLPQ